MTHNQKNWKVTAYLASPLNGDAPMLDALLEHEMAGRSRQAVVITRYSSAPIVGAVHIPCLRGRFGGVEHIPRCSSPILDVASDTEHVERIAKRLSVENAALLHESERRVVAMTNATYKSYHLPVVVRHVRAVSWFVGGAKRRNILSLLDSIDAIGRDRAAGFGRVSRWTCEPADDDYSWFAPCGGDVMLMRPLPWCDELPRSLIGYRRDFGACLGPYWHAERYREIVVPC